MIDTAFAPRFKHDCPTCLYLGQYMEYDLYYCSDKNNPILRTVLARHGDMDSQYVSGWNSRLTPSLREAQTYVELNIL